MQHSSALHIEANPIKAIVICLIGYFFVSLVGLCSKSLSHAVTIPSILFMQNLVCLILNMPNLFKNRNVGLKTTQINTYVIRIMSGLCCYATLFYIIRYMPISEALLYQYSASLWIPLIMLIWLGVRMAKKLWAGILIGFFGIALILKPSQQMIGIVSLIGVLCGVLQALSVVGIRKLALTEPIERMLFYYFLTSILITTPFLLMNPVSLTHKDFIILLLLGGCTYLSQKWIAISFKYAHPSTLAPICYSTIVFSGLIGWLYWHEIPDRLTLLGMALVMIGCLVTLSMSRAAKPSVQDAQLSETSVLTT